MHSHLNVKNDQGDLIQIRFVDSVLLQWLNNGADIQNGRRLQIYGTWFEKPLVRGA